MLVHVEAPFFSNTDTFTCSSKCESTNSPFNFVVFCLLYIILRSLFALNIWAIERYLFSSLANLGGKKFKFDAFESEQKEKEIER